MNILKKSVSFVFALCIFSLFTFLSSCGEGDIMDNRKGLVSSESDVETMQLREGYLIPNSIANKGDEFITQYMAEASDETLALFSKDFLVARYLQDIDRLNEVGDAQEGAFHFSELDFSMYLSNLEIQVLNEKLANFRFIKHPASLRGCPHTRWEPYCWQDYHGNWHGCWVSTGGEC